jgi:hypothetical protein
MTSVINATPIQKTLEKRDPLTTPPVLTTRTMIHAGESNPRAEILNAKGVGKPIDRSGERRVKWLDFRKGGWRH